MTKDEALKLALDAFGEIAWSNETQWQRDRAKEAITAIKEALAQPGQEPVATLWQHGETGRTRITMPDDITDCDARWFKAADLYTTPPQRKPLTDEEIDQLLPEIVNGGTFTVITYGRAVARAIEAAHGIKGEA